MGNDHKRSAYMQDYAALVNECMAAEHAKLAELDGRPPSPKAKAYAAIARLHRRSAWQIRRHENMSRRPAPVVPLLYSARTSARAGEGGSPGAKRAAGIRSGTDPGDDDPSEPSPARACLGCGRDIKKRADGKDRRTDASTCSPRCRKRLERHGPIEVAEPLRAVLCRCNGHHIADEYGDGCAKCGHWLPNALLGVAS